MKPLINFSLLGLLSLGVLSLEARGLNGNFEEDHYDIEIKIDSAITENKDLKTETVELTTARPELVEKNWFVNWDVFLWHAKVGGTSFAFSNNRSSIDIPIQGRTERIPFEWDFGFRAGIGRQFQHDKWSTFLSFTYFVSKDSSTLNGSSINYLTPLKGSYSSAVTEAKSSFALDYYNLDLDLFRHYFISQGVSLKPSLGLKSTWLNLDQVTKYHGGPNLNMNTAETIDSSKLWGIGPKAGFDSTWYLDHGFNVFGLFTASLVYGYFDVEQSSEVSLSNEDSFRIQDTFHRFVPNIQFCLGLGYGKYILQNRYYVDAKLGYEGLYFWRANQMMNLQRFNDSFRYESLSEDVSMHGVTLKLQVVF